VPVRGTQPKLRNFILVRHDRVLAADFDDENIRLDQRGCDRLYFLARPRVELFDDLELPP
jgi:hypothetical protein